MASCFFVFQFARSRCFHSSIVRRSASSVGLERSKVAEMPETPCRWVVGWVVFKLFKNSSIYIPMT